MRRWIPRALPALLVCISLPAAAGAQQPTTPPVATPPPPAPGAAPAPAAPTLPVPAPAAGPTVIVPNGVIILDPYHAATPYNPTVTGQTFPNPALNRPVTTLPCNIPNQNLDPFYRAKPGCNKGGWFKKGGGCGCGCANAGVDGQTPYGMPAHPGCAVCSKGGAYTTGCNSFNFVFGSSRSFFGESSREFFERPPSPDGIKMCPKEYLPPPAPGAFTPAGYVAP